MKKTVAFMSLLAFLGFYSTSCNDFNSLEGGHDLAKSYCKTCHRFPEPGLLDKKTWANYVLPKMGHFMGFGHFELGSYFEEGKIPEAMPLSDWNKIVNFYLMNAPDSLTETGGRHIQVGLKDFELMVPKYSVKDPATTFVGILPGQQQILFADAISKRLYTLSANNVLQDSSRVGEGTVNVRVTGTDIESLAMGVLYPSDEKRGALTAQNILTKESRIVLDSLQRPVYVEYSDLNNDRLEDIVVCEFGNSSGQLSWFENSGVKGYSKHVLRSLPGSVRTQVTDINRDGKPDIVALMAQGDEGIFVYYNKGNGQFEEKRVLQFPPSYGSNYFEMTDWNQDGFTDIIATNGDNGDYPPILKPYHGIRVYVNDGHGNFDEKIFLPMNGACKAMARDFDGDGDLDIASVSYFPDYKQNPEESFIYWENLGDFSFQAFSFKEAFMGRWLTMDTGDIDNDGDTDIVLGNARFPIGSVPEWLTISWNKFSPSILVLKNLKKK
jgi:hypothetical protein